MTDLPSPTSEEVLALISRSTATVGALAVSAPVAPNEVSALVRDLCLMIAAQRMLIISLENQVKPAVADRLQDAFLEGFTNATGRDR